MRRLGSLFLGAATMLAATTARADHQVGNGGDAVVCRDGAGAITSIELLDFYERDALRPTLDLDLGAPELPYQEKLELALTRLGRVDPVRAAAYRDGVRGFFVDLQLSGAPLRDVEDEALTISPECPLEQLALQRNPLVPGDGRYVVDRRLWNELDEDQKAGLVLHEVVYREALLLHGHTDSFQARYFNTLILSSRLGAMTADEYAETIEQLELHDLVWTAPSGDTWTLVRTEFRLYLDAVTTCRSRGAFAAKFYQPDAALLQSPLADALLRDEGLVWLNSTGIGVTDIMVGWYTAEPREFHYHPAVSEKAGLRRNPYALCVNRFAT